MSDVGLATDIRRAKVYRKRIQQSLIVKRSIVIFGHKTSVSLEWQFWQGLKEIAAEQNRTLTSVVTDIDADLTHKNLSSALRLFVLAHFQARAAAQAHTVQTVLQPAEAA